MHCSPRKAMGGAMSMPTRNGKAPSPARFRSGGMNNLKPVPAGNKGLPNLPTAVRNKMGYRKKGGYNK